MKALLIYSPFALRGKIEKRLPRIIEKLETKFTLTVEKTKHTKHATLIAKEACGIYDLIIIAGGDGLINEVVNGVAMQENAPMLALLPFGTVNDLARSIGIPINTQKATEKIMLGSKKPIDVFLANNNFANYVICAGQHTESTYHTKQKSKMRLGWLAYFLQAVKSVFDKNNYDFEISINNNTLPYRFLFAMFLNSKSVAGFKLNKTSSYTDGKFTVILFKKQKGFYNNLIKYLNFFSLFLFGAKSLKHSKRAMVFEAEALEFLNHSLSGVNVDGEHYAPQEVMQIKMLKGAIKWWF